MTNTNETTHYRCPRVGMTGMQSWKATLKLTGLIGLLTAGSIGVGKSLERHPMELRNVGLGGNSYASRPEIVCVFYDSSESNRTPVIKRDKNFDQKTAYDPEGPRIQGKYNVSGYENLWGRYATNIVKIATN